MIEKATKMTMKKMKNAVQEIYAEGEVITLVFPDEVIEEVSTVTMKIIRFYPNFVLVNRGGFRECYSYWDILYKARKDDRNGK